jgi:hypothetical protein
MRCYIKVVWSRDLDVGWKFGIVFWKHTEQRCVHKDLALGSNAKRVKILGASLFNILELTHCLSHAQISIPENQNIT